MTSLKESTMKGFWPRIWQSPTRAALAGVILSAVIASTLYLFNWHTFYDTRTNYSQNRAALTADDIATLALATRAAPGNDADFRMALQQYQNRRNQLITVSRLKGDDRDTPVWVESNNTQIDTSRTILAEEFVLTEDGGQDTGSPLVVNISDAIRPRFIISLTRAWTFSILDYIESPERWVSLALYNRSVPLYGYLLTIMLVGFGTIRAIYRDQQELIRLERQAEEIGDELEQLHLEHEEEVAEFKKQMEHAGHKHEEAVRNRELLKEQLSAIEREYQDLVDTSPQVDPDDSRLREAADRKSRVEHALASYNMKVSHYENELSETRSELDAAEQLLLEVEEKQGGLNAKLKDRNRQIRKLQGAIQDAQKELRSAQMNHLQAGKASLRRKRDLEESQASIEEQLESWVKTGQQASVNFSSHSRVGEVEEQFQRIDQAFVDRYFTHVNNSEYERGARRIIRILADGSAGNDAAAGKLIVVLDEDAGRTLAMRYEIRKDAPDPVHVGFVLALLLRTKCRDFRNFSIRAR